MLPLLSSALHHFRAVLNSLCSPFSSISSDSFLTRSNYLSLIPCHRHSRFLCLHLKFSFLPSYHSNLPLSFSLFCPLIFLPHVVYRHLSFFVNLFLQFTPTIFFFSSFPRSCSLFSSLSLSHFSTLSTLALFHWGSHPLS